MKTRCLIVTIPLLLFSLGVTTAVESAEPMIRPISPALKKPLPEPKQPIQLRAPNGGETIAIGSSYRIRWVARGITGKVSIQLIQGRRNVGVIARNVNAAAGNHIWRVGSVLKARLRAGSGYKIRIVSADGRFSDTSNGSFKVVARAQPVRTPRPLRQIQPVKPQAVPAIRSDKTLPPRGIVSPQSTSPSGGIAPVQADNQEVPAQQGTQEEVQEYQEEPPQQSAQEEMQEEPTEPGYQEEVQEYQEEPPQQSAQEEMQEYQEEPTEPAYQEELPQQGSPEEVQDYQEESAQQSTQEEASAPYITITSPQQYQGWCTDAPHTITWDTNLPSSTLVKIELINSDVAGSVWRTLAESVPNSGSFDWTGINSADFNSVSKGLKVRITTLDNSVSTTGDYFTFGKQLYFEEPNNGMVWRQGAQGRIRWEKVCTLPGPVNLDLLDSNHQVVQNIRSNLSPEPRNSSNLGELYNWPITTAVEPGAYYLRFSSGPISLERSITINEEIVFPKSPHFTITSPQKFSGWCTDSTHTITWNSDLPATTPVKIELVGTDVNGIVVWRTLAASAPNSGSFQWQGINSADYNSVSRSMRVRISTLDDADVSVGDVFTFGKPLYFQEPSAPYTWSHGSTGTIQWEKVCAQPSPLALDLLDSNHQYVMTIASGLNPEPRLSTNKREIYRWQVPASIAPGSYYIHLSTGSVSMEKPINIGN